MTQGFNGIAPLPHLGVIRVHGEDAARFLQGQLTQDFVLLAESQARLAAFCSAKGRMQASFVGFRQDGETILLVCSRDILAATLKRLSMFVLRAKVRLTDASADFVLRGLIGETARAMAGDDAQPWQKVVSGASHAIALYPCEGQPRVLCVAPAGTDAPAGAPLATEVWLWTEVRSGVATITVPIVEAFVPQMLNYESVGGVNFKKGCYPGQEVVARSQFRGTLKRRAFIVHSAMPLAAGQEVFHASDAGQPCGLVAQAAAVPGPDGGFDAIASMQVAAADGAGLAAGSPEGAPLALLPLPYLLVADV